MTLRLDFLDDTSPARIVAAFNSAFGDYAVRMDDRSETWLVNRMRKNAVDWSCSAGAFDGDELVGFSLTGVDDWQGIPSAYDAATGIVPGFRGQGLARRLLDHLAPRLRERGVRRFQLEVLQENEPAIKAYRRLGFETTREFDCYMWPDEARRACAERTAASDVEIRPIGKRDPARLAAHLDFHPSWECSLAAIERIPDEVLAFGAFDGDELLGTIVYYPLLGWLMNLVVARNARRRGVGSELLRHLAGSLPDDADPVRLINVERGDAPMTAFAGSAGFELQISQFEMAMDL